MNTAPGSGATPTSPQGTRTHDPFDTRNEKKPETFCLFCGMPMTRDEMGITARDIRAADWSEHDFVEVTIHGCKPCLRVRKQWLKEGIRGADERRKQDIAARIAAQGTANI